MPSIIDELMKTRRGRIQYGLIFAIPITLVSVYLTYATFPIITATTLNHEVGFGATIISYGPQPPQWLLQAVAIGVFAVGFSTGFFMKEVDRLSHRIERRLFGITFEEVVFGRGVIGDNE